MPRLTASDAPAIAPNSDQRGVPEGPPAGDTGCHVSAEQREYRTVGHREHEKRRGRRQPRIDTAQSKQQRRAEAEHQLAGEHRGHAAKHQAPIRANSGRNAGYSAL